MALEDKDDSQSQITNTDLHGHLQVCSPRSFLVLLIQDFTLILCFSKKKSASLKPALSSQIAWF